MKLSKMHIEGSSLLILCEAADTALGKVCMQLRSEFRMQIHVRVSLRTFAEHKQITSGKMTGVRYILR